MGRKWCAVAVTVAAVMALATWAQAAVSEEMIQKIMAAMPAKAIAKPAKARKLLVFTLAKGYKHGSIPVAAKALEIMGKKTRAFEATESADPAVFKAETLAKFDAVLMDNCTSAPDKADLITDEELKKSILDFISVQGKGWIGIHAATDCNYHWPEYGEMMGGYFNGHPFRRISVKLDDPGSPLSAPFREKGFQIEDEIYTFKDPYSREKLRVLLSIDWENSHLSGGTRSDNDYALSWIHEYGKGRVFYCAFGHEDYIFWNPAILKHYLAGLQYVLGDLKADATPSAKLQPTPKPARGPDLANLGPKIMKAPLIYYAPASTAAKAAADGWITLFDGKSLDAWMFPKGSWAVEDGVLARKGGGNIWTKPSFGDFVLDLEFKVTKGTNSGIFLRSPKGEENWLQGSIEIQILDSFGDRKPNRQDCGAIFDCLAPSVAAEKPIGEWNHMTITFKGHGLKVVLNSKAIIDADLAKWTEAHKNPDGTPNKFDTPYKDMPKVGHIGLQDHGSAVWYRHIKIKPLTAETK